MKIKSIICIAALALGFAACRHAQGWGVEGTLEGANGQKVAIEGFNNGRWYLIDSVEVSKDGKFAWQAETPAAYPDVYRLSLDGNAIYFPIDSVDHVKVSGTLATGTVGGTPAAEHLQHVENLISEALLAGVSLEGDTPLKHTLVNEIAADSTGIVAYYIINKTIGGKPLFDPADRFDCRIYGAVAQRFNQLRPNDPRTAWLKSIYLAGKTAQGGEVPVREYEASVTGLIDLGLYDNQGTLHQLSDVAGKGQPVVLSFTRYDLESSTAYNVLLNEIFTAGTPVYQVSFDSDDVHWKQNAANLPWITVYAPQAQVARIANSYNVSQLPLTYIIDGKGDIAARIEDASTLKAALAKVK